LRAQYTADREPPGPSSRKTGLVITEIMYNPRPIPGVANTNITHEFVEIFNSKSWAEDLSGYFIDGVVRYTFPTGTVLNAGAYIVVARVPGMIQTNYGITNVLGPWGGATTNRLSTEAGQIRLRSSLGAVLLEVNYSDSPPWPETADGTGHSLALVRPSWGEDNYQAWAQSDKVGGSPGVPEPFDPEPFASIVINELQNHSDPSDWIEIYNHSNEPVVMSGAWLSDDPRTNKFRIPDGTIIGPGSFMSWDQTQLGFELFAGGETIFLWNSNQTRVIDVVDFRGASNNISQGRYPDGGPHFYGMSSNTRNAANAVPMRYSVIINEIMFNPISGSIDDEYVEIHNRSAAPANLAGYEFVTGIGYAFPTNALTQSMPAGAHWVVARNPANLATIYTNLSTNVNLFGPYTGSLANGGERLVLASADYDNVQGPNGTVVEKLNVVVSDLTYGDGGKWGNWSDGLGSSLELIDIEGDLHHPSNWADSNDTGESQWTAIEYTGPIGETLGSPANDALIIMLQGLGECLVDEVEVRVDNGPNLVANGSFEAGLDGWMLQGSHDFSTLENEGFIGSKSLHVRTGSRGDNQSNRILSQPFTHSIPSGAHQISIRAKVCWLRGFPEILLRLHGSATEAYGRMSLPRRLGTPGVVNSTRIPNAGPAVYNVTHAPLLPQTNQNVVVTARAIDRQGVSSINLRYRVDPNPNYTDVPMVDNGTAGDAIANDGILSAIIPAQSYGEMVAFYVEARDSQNAAGTFPKEVFPRPGLDRCYPTDALAKECLVRWGEVQMPGDFPTYHLWVSQVNSNRWHTRNAMDNTVLDATFVYNNTRVMYNGQPLFSGSPFHRTNSTAGPAGPLRVDYEMNFPDDDPLFGATDFVLNNPGNADQFTITDLSAIREQTVYKLFEGLGLPHNHRRYIHMFVNGSQRSTAYERAGNFIFEDSQQPNGDMTAQWFPDSAGGQLFKVEDWFEFETNGFDVAIYNDADMTRRTILQNGQETFVPAPYRFMFRKRSVGVGNSANDYSTIFALIDATSPPDNPTNSVVDPDVFGAVADYEAWMRHFAIQRAVGNFDSFGWNRGKNDYLYQTTNGFAHMPWDIDYSLGLGRPANEPLFDSNDPRITAMFNTPVIQRAYWRAFHDLVNGPLRNEVLDPFIDARVTALLSNNINIDLAEVANTKTYIAERRAFLQSQLETVEVPFALETPSYFEADTNLLILTGTAPVGVKTILVNGVAYPMTWISPTHFVMHFVLQAGANTFTLQGYDRFGSNIVGATASVTAIFSADELNPVGSLIINEVLHAPSIPDTQFIEIINRSQNSFDLSGWRLEGAGLIFPLGSIVTDGQTLVLARNRSAFNGAFPGVPVFSTFNTTLTATQLLMLTRTVSNVVQTVDAVRFDRSAPWVIPAAGQSMQLIDASQDNGRAANWDVSALVPVTPGASNSVAFALPPFDPVWLNEIQHVSLAGLVDNIGEPSPWIEIYNAGLTPVSLDNYFLAENFSSNLTQWPFPAGASLAAGEHKVIWADGDPSQDTATEWHTSFTLQRSGRLALTRLTNGVPQVVDHLAWRWLGANVTFGSHPEGQLIFRSTLVEPTPGALNVGRPYPIVINEFVAVNVNSLRDPADSDADDWIELWNGGQHTIDLGGMYLTDSQFDPLKFRVPTNGQYRIPPGGFLIVWADDEAGQNNPTRPELHTNFRLNNSSGFIGLWAPDGTTPVDLIAYGPQTGDVSSGRYGDGGDAGLGGFGTYYMTRPTPRNPNGISSYNSPPRLPTPTNVFITPGQGLTTVVRATDPDLQTLTYTTNAASALPGSLLSQGGSYRWTVPTNQPLGEYPITITVTDSGTPPLSDTVTFSYIVRLPGTVSTNGVLGPQIHSVAAVAGDQATFTIDTTVGRTYRVFYTDDLNLPLWTQLGPDFVAANPTASISDSAANPRRFYRVQQVN
jgi:hypothetical protein